MKTTTASLLFHPAFWSSLFLLLANDMYGKYAFPGWLTGKLSDVAGMVVLPVFCRVIFPFLTKRAVFVLCTVFFAWWKSPLSQPVITMANSMLHLPICRVVDYSDLLALAALPFALQAKPVALNLSGLWAASLRWAMGGVAFISLCSTSVYRNLFQAHPFSTDVYFDETFSQKQSAAAVLRKLSEKSISYRIDSVVYYPVTNQHNLYYKVPAATGSAFAWQQVAQPPDSTIYIRWEGAPYYLIPKYETGERTFRNIRFTLSENASKTKTKITVQMFQSNGLSGPAIWSRKEKKPYKEIFEQLFGE